MLDLSFACLFVCAIYLCLLLLYFLVVDCVLIKLVICGVGGILWIAWFVGYWLFGFGFMST